MKNYYHIFLHMEFCQIMLTISQNVPNLYLSIDWKYLLAINPENAKVCSGRSKKISGLLLIYIFDLKTKKSVILLLGVI